MSIKIMSKVWEDSTTDGSILLVLLALSDNANDEGICWPSIDTIARKARISRRTAQRAIHELENINEIVCLKRGAGNTSTRYKVTLGRGVKMSPVTQVTGRGDTGDTLTVNESSNKDNCVSDETLMCVLKLLDIWNASPYTTAHKYDKNKNMSKLVLSICTNVAYLKNGIFLQKRRCINASMRKRYGISDDDFKKCFTDAEIIQGVVNYLLQFDAGYWRAGQDSLHFGMNKVFFNERSKDNPSLFLKLFYNKPQPVQKTETVTLPTYMQKSFETMQQFLESDPIYDRGLTDKEVVALKKAVKEIAAKRIEYIERVGQVYMIDDAPSANPFRSDVGADHESAKQLDGFVQLYCNFLRVENDKLIQFMRDQGNMHSPIPVGKLAPSGDKSKWGGFIKWCGQEVHCNGFYLELEPSDARLRGIKSEVEHDMHVHSQRRTAACNTKREAK